MLSDVCFYDGYTEKNENHYELKIYSLVGQDKHCLCFFIGDDENKTLSKFASNIPYEKEIIVETNGKKHLIPISSYINKNENNKYKFVFSFEENEMPRTKSGVLALCLFDTKDIVKFIKTTYPKYGRDDKNIIIYLDKMVLDYSINIRF